MKKEWNAPILVELNINKTMLNTKPGEFLDDSFDAGTHWSNLTWGDS